MRSSVWRRHLTPRSTIFCIWNSWAAPFHSWSRTIHLPSQHPLYSPLTPFQPYGLSTNLECPKMIIPLNIPSSTRDPPFDLLTLTWPTAASVSIHYVYLEPSNHTLVLSPGM